MANKYTPEKRTIGQLLSMTNPPILVPDWQRNYSWTSSEIEAFWQDLIKFDQKYQGDNINDQEYFLGSIVMVDNTIDHLLLDGQQRLATSTILLSVIRDFLARYSQDAAVRVQTRYLSDFDDAANRNTYKMRLNRFDRDFFQREIVEQRLADHVAVEPRIESHKFIKKARDFFENKFEEIYVSAQSQQEANQKTLRILKVLTNHLSVVAVISGDEDNAASVFETLNDRGIGLSTPDLLRNFILRRTNPENIEEVIDLWEDILDIEKDTKLNVFIRHYWVSHYGDVKSRSLYREIKDILSNNNIDSLEFSRSLRDAASIYSDIASSSFENPDVSKLLNDINSIGSGVLYPCILSSIEVFGVDESQNVIRALLVTFVRHKIIGDLESSKLENMIFGLAQEIRQGISEDTLIAKLKDFSPDDDRFSESFKTASLSNKSHAYYILREIELFKRRTEELDVNPPRKVHVEHIYPQNPQEGHRLANHNKIIDRIGNLTLLSRKLNTAIKNSPFYIKKQHYQGSELVLTLDLCNDNNWDVDEINARQIVLAGCARRIWAY